MHIHHVECGRRVAAGDVEGDRHRSMVVPGRNKERMNEEPTLTLGDDRLPREPGFSYSLVSWPVITQAPDLQFRTHSLGDFVLAALLLVAAGGCVLRGADWQRPLATRRYLGSLASCTACLASGLGDFQGMGSNGG